MENRRSFLTKATLGVAATAGASSAPAASDQVVVGFIGTGIRATGALIPQFKFNNGFRVAALCDVYKPNLEQAATLVGGNVDTYGDYRRVLDRKDIDVVVVATPDHWHCPIVIEACEAGKDIYLEKPVSSTLRIGTWASPSPRAPRPRCLDGSAGRRTTASRTRPTSPGSIRTSSPTTARVRTFSAPICGATQVCCSSTVTATAFGRWAATAAALAGNRRLKRKR